MTKKRKGRGKIKKKEKGKGDESSIKRKGNIGVEKGGGEKVDKEKERGTG